MIRKNLSHSNLVSQNVNGRVLARQSSGFGRGSKMKNGDNQNSNSYNKAGNKSNNK